MQKTSPPWHYLFPQATGIQEDRKVGQVVRGWWQSGLENALIVIGHGLCSEGLSFDYGEISEHIELLPQQSNFQKFPKSPSSQAHFSNQNLDD